MTQPYIPEEWNPQPHQCKKPQALWFKNHLFYIYIYIYIYIGICYWEVLFWLKYQTLYAKTCIQFCSISSVTHKTV